MSGAARIVRCPTCGERALWAAENAFRPFCSERCRLIDLGAWANDEYVVGGADAGQIDSNDEADAADPLR